MKKNLKKMALGAMVALIVVVAGVFQDDSKREPKVMNLFIPSLQAQEGMWEPMGVNCVVGDSIIGHGVGCFSGNNPSCFPENCPPGP